MAAQPAELLRLATAGSVDDGKSTLIGRLLLDAKLLFEDQLDALHAATATAPDLAAITDGLRAEREQGITIDVAYRFFATPAALVHHRRHARATSATRATWSPAPRPPTSRWCWSTPATASSSSRAATPTSPRCSGSATWSRA